MRAFSAAVFCGRKTNSCWRFWDKGFWGKRLLQKEKSESQGWQKHLIFGQVKYSAAAGYLPTYSKRIPLHQTNKDIGI